VFGTDGKALGAPFVHRFTASGKGHLSSLNRIEVDETHCDYKKQDFTKNTGSGLGGLWSRRKKEHSKNL